MKSKIFINYRKDDSPWNSLALYQELIKHFGKESIFKDFNTITPGTDFVESIEEALESCDVLLVLISEHWADIKDKNGNLRINNEDDFVRIEIATALKRKIKVIPVLFDNAVLPPATDLPEDLKSLARRQSIEIDKTRFEADTARLVAAIKNILQTPSARAPKTSDNNAGNDLEKKEADKEEIISAPTPDVSSFSNKRFTAKKGIVFLVVLAGIIILSYFLINLFSNKKEESTTALTSGDSTVTNAGIVTDSAKIIPPDTSTARKKKESNTVIHNNTTKEKPGRVPANPVGQNNDKPAIKVEPTTKDSVGLKENNY